MEQKEIKFLSWYDSWHDHPRLREDVARFGEAEARHKHAHWLIFLSTLFWVSLFLFVSILSDLKTENTAQAQGALTLGKSGDRLTINGTPTFLLMISYFDAMGASDVNLNSDFANLLSRGFNGIRILPNWPPLSSTTIPQTNKLMDGSGNLRSGRLSALINIIQRAQNYGLIVDITFTRETISGLSAAEFRDGIISATQGLLPYRNIYFDIQNEADHDGTTCGTARLCPSEARQIRDAVKAVDPQRIVTVSLNSDSNNEPSYIINGAMDFHPAHGPFSTLSGTRAFVAGEKTAVPGLPVHLQEPDRCRSNPCGYTASQFFTAAQDAKCAVAAGWTFHTSAGYNLGSIFSQFNSVENQVVNGLFPQLSSTGWFSCTSGGPPPPPPPPGPPPPLPSPIVLATPCDPTQLPPPPYDVIVVCDFSPKTAAPGDTIQISGYYMGNVVEMANVLDGSVEEIIGQLNSDYTSLLFSVPPGTVDGRYTIGVRGYDGTSQAIVSGELVISSTGAPVPPVDVPAEPFNPPQPPVPLPPADDFQELIGSAFNYAVIIVGIAVFVMILYAGFLWMTSAANPGNIATAKGYITNAILGAILLLSAYVILYTINPELVGGGFTLEGLKAPTPLSTSTTQSMVAVSEPSAASAIMAGCVPSTEITEFLAVQCPPDAATTGLIPDPVIEAFDVNANNQIGATTLQNGGNRGGGRKIVVLDTGINYNHPDLASSYLGGKDFINNDNDPMDDGAGGAAASHGSHVSGIITADGIDPRAIGVAPLAGIIAGKILDKTGTGNWSKMLDAIYWAVDGPDGIHGTADDFNADAINISVGGGSYSSICDNTDETTRLMARALQYARDNGVLPVVAAGNSSRGVVMPGCIDAAFTVGAIDSSDRIAVFSGRGSSVDITAPGINIYSTLINGYGTKSGTSMATPVVSGLVALIKSANPGYTTTQVEQAIIGTACDLGTIGKDTTFGWGRVAAVPGSCTAPPPPPTSSTPRGTLTISPTTCTKGVLAGNPNCNLNINYAISNLAVATSILFSKDNILFQAIQCGAGPCTGQVADPNPRSGTHQYTLRLSTGATIGRANAYIRSLGSIGTNFNSCAKLANSANINCDVNLSIRAQGGVPSSVVVKRDGVNWRVIQCATSPCTANLTDSNPNLGIHTYTLHDGSSDDKLDRETVTITIQTRTTTPPPPPGPGPAITQCNPAGTTCLTAQLWPVGTNCGNQPSIGPGPCVVLNHRVGNADITGGYATGFVSITKDGAGLFNIRQSDGDLPAGTRIDRGSFTAGTHTYQLLDGTTRNVIVSVTITVTGGGTSPSQQTVTLCSGINYTGTCEKFASNDYNLADNLIGSDTVSSVILDTSDIRLCADINYGGVCENITANDPDLSNNTIGDNNASSISSL